MKIEHCTGAIIATNDCSRGFSCCVEDKKLAKSFSEHKILTRDKFLKLVGNTTRNLAMYNYVVESIGLAGIETEYQVAAYLSNLMGETKLFTAIESTVRLKDIDPAIGNNQTGDGTKYRGRGGIQLKGREGRSLESV